MEPDERGRALPDLDDDELVYELHRLGLTVMVTDDFNMRRDVRTLVAIEQTRMTVLTAESVNHDPVLATGVLLRDLVPVLRRRLPRGVIFNVKPTQPRELRSRSLLEGLVDDADAAIRTHGKPFAERRKYPDDDPRRLFPGFRRA